MGAGATAKAKKKQAVTERPALGALGYVTLLAMLAAFAQSPLGSVAPGLPMSDYLDDAALGLMVIAAFRQLGSAPGAPVLAVVGWCSFIFFAAMFSDFDAGGTFVVARQILVPALLILVGLALTREQWGRVRRLAVWIGIVNALYMLIELAGIHLLDPTSLETFNDGRGVTLNGLPSYYRYWLGGGTTITRLGGTVLNPPVAGLVTAAAFVFLWHDRAFKRRQWWLVLLGAVSVMTFSRGGLLIIGLAVVMPALLRRIGPIGTVTLMAPALYLVGTRVSEDGNSSSHADGLATGLAHAAEFPWFGQGFGSVGNYVKSLNLAEASESLAGIAFSAAGVPMVALVAALLVTLWRVGSSSPTTWEASLGIGIVVAALFSESAGALNGSIPLWLAVGVALRERHGAVKRCGPRRPWIATRCRTRPRRSLRPSGSGSPSLRPAPR